MHVTARCISHVPVCFVLFPPSPHPFRALSFPAQDNVTDSSAGEARKEVRRTRTYTHMHARQQPQNVALSVDRAGETRQNVARLSQRGRPVHACSFVVSLRTHKRTHSTRTTSTSLSYRPWQTARRQSVLGNALIN